MVCCLGHGAKGKEQREKGKDSDDRRQMTEGRRQRAKSLEHRAPVKSASLVFCEKFNGAGLILIRVDISASGNTSVQGFSVQSSGE